MTELIENSESQKRQYIDAESVFAELRRVRKEVVATNGEMALMHTMHPLDFVKIKRTLAASPTRDPLKVSKDRLQADLVEELVRTHLPQYAINSTADAPGRSPAARP